jgi:SAM-dependent methyltransferase
MSLPADPLHTLKTYYRARAPEHDSVYAKPERQADLRALERWIPQVLTDRHVLEIGAGTGYWTQFLAPAVNTLLAIDCAQEVLEIARARVRSERVTFLVADAYALPEGLGTLDAAFAGFWWSHAPRSQVRSFLDGLHRRLRPRAKVLLVDNLHVEGSSSPIALRDDEGNSYQARQLRDGREFMVLKNFPDEAQLRADIEGLGVHAVYRRWEHYWAFQYEVAARPS